MWIKVLAGFTCMWIPLIAIAVDDTSANSSQYLSVADSIRAMDKNSDGIVTVYEVRALIESRHGKNYKKDVLDDMEASASGKSCSTPFAKSLY